MNILITTFEGDIAGSTNSIFYLARGLAERGHRVFVGCRQESVLFQLVQQTKAIPIAMTFRSKFDRQNMRQIRDAVIKYDIELINAQSSKDRYTTAFAKWLYGLRVAIVHTRRQMPLSSGLFIQNWFYVSATEKIVAVSQGVKDGLVKLGIPERHVQVILNGTPKEKYALNEPQITQQYRQQYGIEPGDIVIGCIARHKWQIQILQAAAQIEQPLKILFVGIDPNDDMRAVAQTFKVPHQVIYSGTVSGKEALYHFPLLTVNILPSTTEGLSQSLLEAMALGVPVIATAAAGNLDLIQNEQNGLLFEHGNIEQLRACIERLLTDQGFRMLLIANGKKTALDDFSIEKVIGNYETFFGEIIGKYQQKS